MGAQDITLIGFFACTGLLLIPLFVDFYYKLDLFTPIVVAFIRMTIQLVGAGILLTFLFLWDHVALNFAWFFFMMIVAASSVIAHSELRFKAFFLPVVVSFFVSTLLVVTYFNYLVVQIESVFTAKYLIVISGMIMGNSLKNNIIGLSSFYKSIVHDKARYEYFLASGFSHWETLKPFIRESLTIAFKPTIAAMATMGVIALPGMMTGQILGGSEPLVAIKYQIAIMIAIFAASVLSLILTLQLTIRQSFDDFGNLKREMLK